jgi:hypothetical protein
MSDRPEPAADEAVASEKSDADVENDERDARAVRALLKRSLAKDAENAPHLLPGVQRRIRARSRGKFFADGWSTTQARASYALIGLLTLAIVVLAYIALSPIDMR